MNLIPATVSRAGHRTLLKLNASSPTILVVSGIVGFGVTTALAIAATRKLDPTLTKHTSDRKVIELTNYGSDKDRQRAITRLYAGTALSLTKIYGPTIVAGSLSAAAVLSGHNILKGRHVATMAAYSGLAEEFRSYRARVAKTLGSEAEQEIRDGAHGEWEDDPNHKGEVKRVMKYDLEENAGYLRPWFDETNVNWTRDPVANYLFLKGVQAHMNNLLKFRGHVFLSDVYEALNLTRVGEAQVAGWLQNGDGDNFVSFGFMESENPHTVAFRNGAENTVQLNFNIDGLIWDKI